jgi:hypothetical protein
MHGAYNVKPTVLSSGILIKIVYTFLFSSKYAI